MGYHVVKKEQQIIAVCGVKNSGKTTLLVKLVEALSKEGIRVAVIKHDGHDFTCDVPGTDSYKLHQAGAYGTAVFSDYRTFIHKEGCQEREQELIRQFPEADIILIEGMKNSNYAKIEVIRKEISEYPVSNPQGRFLIATDWDLQKFDEPARNIDDIESILEEIVKKERKQ